MDIEKYDNFLTQIPKLIIQEGNNITTYLQIISYLAKEKNIAE